MLSMQGVCRLAESRTGTFPWGALAGETESQINNENELKQNKSMNTITTKERRFITRTGALASPSSSATAGR
jgi:hypothetical protein